MSPGRIIPRFRHHVLVAFPMLAFAALGGLPVAGQVGTVPGAGSSLPSSSVSATSTIPSTVSGVVINAVTGLPVARTLVRLNDRAVLTDHDGKFEFDQNTEAQGNMMVIKPGFSSSPSDSETSNIFFQSNQLAVPLRLLLYPEALLTGTVLGPEGEPLPGILVSARRSLYDELGRRMVNAGQTQTDSHGNFRMPVPGDSYKIETRYVPKDKATGLAVLPVEVPAESSFDTSDVIRIHSGEEQHFDLRPAVRQTHRVTVTVDSSEREMGSVRITARSSNGSIFQINASSNGSTGDTTMELPQGTYTLIARRNNSGAPEEGEATITVPDHDISGVVLHFSSIPSIPVDLLIDEASTSDNSEPSLQQFNLVLENDQPDLEQQSATIRLTTAANHEFRFLASPGSYHLTARGAGEWYVKSVGDGTSNVLEQGLVVAPGAGGTPLRVMVSNQTASLQGTVKLNGIPSICWIYLIPTTPSAEAVLSMRSNAEGGFTNAHVPPGSYQAIAFERRHSANYRDPDALGTFASHVQSITVNAGDTATLDLDAVGNVEMLP